MRNGLAACIYRELEISEKQSEEGKVHDAMESCRMKYRMN